MLRRNAAWDHFGESTFDKLRRFGPAPTARALAAEAAIGQNAEGSLERVAPAIACVIVREPNDGPKPGAVTKLEARGGVAFAHAGQPVDGGIVTDGRAERP